jgi:hypothetical protein
VVVATSQSIYFNMMGLKPLRLQYFASCAFGWSLSLPVLILRGLALNLYLVNLALVPLSAQVFGSDLRQGARMPDNPSDD